MENYTIQLAEGVERITESGVIRKVLLLPENVGVTSFEMGVLILNPGQEWGYPRHSHSNEEGYFVLQGKGFQVVGDSKFDIEQNTAVYIPPNKNHITRNNGDDPLWVLYVREPREYRT
jgi:mannose-6-phosphate isomerase-like protein (cupin superfamily)